MNKWSRLLYGAMMLAGIGFAMRGALHQLQLYPQPPYVVGEGGCSDVYHGIEYRFPARREHGGFMCVMADAPPLCQIKPCYLKAIQDCLPPCPTPSHHDSGTEDTK